MADTVIYSGAWGASRAFHALKNKKQGKPLVIIASDNKVQFDEIVADVELFSDGLQVLSLPPYFQEPFEEARVLSSIMSARSNALYSMLHADDYVLVVSPYSILKKLPSIIDFQKNELLISKGAVYERKTLEDILDTLGYVHVESVTGVGEYNVRGGLIDIFPVDSTIPVRIEFFDDEVDELFYYSPDNQMRVRKTDSVRILPCSDLLISTKALYESLQDEVIKERVETFGKFAGYHWYAPLINYEGGTMFDYLGDKCSFVSLSTVWHEELEAFSNAVYDKHTQGKVSKEMLLNFISATEARKKVQDSGVEVISDITDSIEAVSLKYQSTKVKFAFEKRNLYQSLKNFMSTVEPLKKRKFRIILACESDKFTNIFKEFVRDYDIFPKTINSFDDVGEDGVYIYPKHISGGFIDNDAMLVLVSDLDIFGYSKRKSRGKKREVFNTSIADLEVGDYVVHTNHGIGRYKGIKRVTIAGVDGEYLQLEYDGSDILYVPLHSITQLQKYIGLNDSTPKLNSLKGSAWQKVKKHAKESAKSIAEDLLRLYAERKAKKGYAFLDDGDLVEQFESCFEYDETEDQLSAIIDVYRDMEQETPMERLVCGDVGFGKTEVAMRATCKAISCSKQVAVLVPTTILARQHYETFKKRFADIAVNIDYVSRFRTARETKDIFGKMADGSLDVIIGTHKILSKELSFKDLGLLVIDEEQRFGVSHKEKISAIKRNVDTLTLSATPIPRTLQLSLSGIRDMSIIETPPENRLPVVVKVIRLDEDMTKAIKFELERGGQVFFLHNKVSNITEVAAEIKARIPLAKIDYAHGQMDAKTIENKLQAFYAGDIDVLVSTTIIENGIDIPNVNTIIINKAANFGLAQLYQLKGRVGRSTRRGYCYLAVENMSSLTPIAQKRLSIIQQLSDLGSGFKIAMYDLQLRGAGNILGAEQSGFVVRVGYELYVNMIEEAVSEMKGEYTNITDTEINSNIAYFISAEYIEDTRIRFDYYRRFASVYDIESMNEILAELEATYGELPKEVISLGYVMLVKNLGSKLGAEKVNITKSGCKIHFSKETKLSFELISLSANKSNAIYKFISEYELSVVIPANNTLKGVSEFFINMKKYSDSEPIGSINEA